MYRCIHIILLEKQKLLRKSWLLKAFSLEEGRISVILPERRTLFPAEPALYCMEVEFNQNGLATCHHIELLEGFFEEHHFQMHQLCSRIFNYFPLSEPSPFAFGRYLSALRKSTDQESARINSVWFLASILIKEGFIGKNRKILELVRTRKTENLPEVWRLVKRGLVELEGKG